MTGKVQTVILITTLFSLCGCGYERPKAEPPPTSEEESMLRLAEAKLTAHSVFPDGQDVVLEDVGIYIFLPDMSWETVSREEGCVSFSDGENYIDVYYTEGTEESYGNVPKSKNDITGILKKSGIPEDQFEILRFDYVENEGIKAYSYTIKFTIDIDGGETDEVYSVSRSLCTEDMICAAVGQVYDEDEVSECEKAEESLTLY